MTSYRRQPLQTVLRQFKLCSETVTFLSTSLVSSCSVRENIASQRKYRKTVVHQPNQARTLFSCLSFFSLSIALFVVHPPKFGYANVVVSLSLSHRHTHIYIYMDPSSTHKSLNCQHRSDTHLDDQAEAIKRKRRISLAASFSDVVVWVNCNFTEDGNASLHRPQVYGPQLMSQSGSTDNGTA